MNLIEHDDDCPYCGEPITLLLDNTEEEQHYIEDCQVCCRPINIKVRFYTSDEYQIKLLAEND
jgi:hypothetical protein